MRLQAYNDLINNIIDMNVSKSDCMCLANGFIKLVRRGNNPNKKTLVDIPYVS